jgi:hypothetical protein
VNTKDVPGSTNDAAHTPGLAWRCKRVTQPWCKLYMIILGQVLFACVLLSVSKKEVLTLFKVRFCLCIIMPIANWPFCYESAQWCCKVQNRPPIKQA